MAKNAILAVFDDRGELERTMEDLALAGVDRSQLSLLSAGAAKAEMSGSGTLPASSHDEPVTGQDKGNLSGMVASIPAYLAAVAAAGVTVASGGTLAGVAIAALAAGAGAGAVGAGAARLLSNSIDESYEQKLKEGGIMLVVTPQTDAEQEAAMKILRGTAARDVSLHPLPS